jgi:hypothetical protein
MQQLAVNRLRFPGRCAVQRSPTDSIEFKTVKGLLIGDMLLRDVPDRDAAQTFVGLEERTERDWIIQIYRDQAGELTAVRVIDRAQFKPGDFSEP